MPDALVHVPGYTIHRHDCLIGQGGRACLFVKESTAVRPCLHSHSSEAVFIASLLLFKRLVVVFRSLHSLSSCLLDSLFSFRCNSNRTLTVTRAQATTCLALPDVHTRSDLQFLSYTATKEWNSLPPPICSVYSQPAFLMHLHNHLGHPEKRLRSVGTA